MADTNFYLQAQPDGNKAFKQPHESYCQVQSETKGTVILCVGLASGSLSHESSMTMQAFVFPVYTIRFLNNMLFNYINIATS